MTVAHEPWLVVLSLIVAFQGSFVGLSLGVQVTDAVDPRRRFLLASAALTLALAIWSMHFVGMLAARLPVVVDFLVLPTLLSFLVCVLVVGVAVFAASNGPLTPVRLGLSALVMGAGICTMHYLGMYALHASSRMVHDPVYVVASFLVAFNAAGLALWLSFGSGKRPPIVVSAAVLALAISAMHYTAMAGMLIFPRTEGVSFIAPAVTPGTLAIIVACVAFLVSGLFLLTLVPDTQRTAANSGNGQRDRGGNGPSWTAESGQGIGVFSGLNARLHEAGAIEGLIHPADGSGEAPRRAAGLQAAPSQKSASAHGCRALPVERDGAKGMVNTSDIVAVHADAHYTQLFDGTRNHFCPLAISEVEQQLDPKTFSRVHRSHIVNLTRVSSYKRSGDGGVLTMEGEGRHCVPVSRSRWTRVKTRLAEQTSEEPLLAVQTAAAE
ncbi:MHYT domain-containing protein [Roseibium aggregatum]|uniref:Carbon monoxide dehydrogenase n=1 Tax=Roseibium aggregatum TaxID=187304 RepID=A0A926S567_9HYPH|nr:MHYT domain-containing protein [Roseibium aggregatum]MBD1545122.1 carbon monoxide dehydrogenase [Roseibium aggregatum]